MLMKNRRLNLLFLCIICFFSLQGLVHSSTRGLLMAARIDGYFDEPNFTATSESDEMVVGSEQYELQNANNSLTVATATTKEHPVIEGPRNSEVEVDGDQNSGPGVATFIIFFVVIAWLTTVGGPKEN